MKNIKLSYLWIATGIVTLLFGVIDPESPAAVVLLIVWIALLVMSIMRTVQYFKSRPKREVIKPVQNNIQPTIETPREIIKEPIMPKVRTYVAGMSYREKNVNRVIRQLFSEGVFDKYDGVTTKEMKETGTRYYEIPMDRVLGNIEFEPTNQYNPKAIKVMVDNIHIGYIPDDDLDQVYKKLETKSIHKVWVTFRGGKYKQYDEFEEEFEIGSYGVNADIVLEFK